MLSGVCRLLAMPKKYTLLRWQVTRRQPRIVSLYGVMAEWRRLRMAVGDDYVMVWSVAVTRASFIGSFGTTDGALLVSGRDAKHYHWGRHQLLRIALAL